MSDTSRTPLYTLDAASQRLMQRHAAWWQRKGSLCTRVHGAPLGKLWLPLAGGATAEEDIDLTPEMLDLDRLAGEPLAPGKLEMKGDLFRVESPFVRVPWVEAIIGAPIRATILGGSMRGRAFIHDWSEWNVKACRQERWLDLLQRLTALLVERSGGRYAVTQTLMRGPCDLAESALGPELMCLSMYDHPRELARFLTEASDTFIEILRAQLQLIPPLQGGYVNPFGIWAPGTIVRTQCDASAILSPNQYAEWYLPHDERISAAADYSVIHLHSVSLHVVDKLLAVERPQAIQITLETSATAPSLQAMLPIFRRILAVKPLIADGPLTDAEVRVLQDGLPADGLCIIARQAAW